MSTRAQFILSALMPLMGAGCSTLLMRKADSTILVSPGDTGTIEYEFHNDGEPGSNRRTEEAWPSTSTLRGFSARSIAVTSITVKETGETSPITIEPGDTRTFVISYKVAETATEGTALLLIDMRMLNMFTEPPPSELGSKVAFKIRRKAS